MNDRAPTTGRPGPRFTPLSGFVDAETSQEANDATELMRTYARLNETDRGRLRAIAQVMAATSP